MDGIGGLIKSHCRRITLSRKQTITSANDVLFACQNLQVQCLLYTEDDVKQVSTEFQDSLEATRSTKNIQRIDYISVTGLDCIDAKTTTTSSTNTAFCLSEETHAPFQVINVDQYVAVAYNDSWYPGIVTKQEANIIHVSFMQRVDGGKFRWPKHHEVEMIDSRNIMGLLSPPVPKGTTRITFEFASDEMKVMNDMFIRL